jgi:hypothetical protein
MTLHYNEIKGVSYNLMRLFTRKPVTKSGVYQLTASLSMKNLVLNHYIRGVFFPGSLLFRLLSS